MNPRLSPEQRSACLEMMYRGFVQIRSASQAGDLARVEAISDALHNLPHLVGPESEAGWNLTTFRELYLEPLLGRYPDLTWLVEPLGSPAPG